ncbi:hypothetical protein AADZ84_15465 [Colwelliaceae bacterium MEBiC 14330]
MISNIIIPTADLSGAEAFYDRFLSLFGAIKIKQNSHKILWKCRNENVGLMVCEQEKSTIVKRSNALTVALKAENPAEVNMIYQVALRLGASCAGKPTTTEIGESEAYFFDADKNKFAIIFSQQAKFNS